MKSDIEGTDCQQSLAAGGKIFTIVFFLDENTVPSF